MRLVWRKKAKELKYIALNVIVVRCILYIKVRMLLAQTIDIARMSVLLHFIKCLRVNGISTKSKRIA